MFSFGFIEEITGNMRNSALMLCIFFIIGLILLITLHKEERKIQKKV
jgi:UMF1 family MFS transporter